MNNYVQNVSKTHAMNEPILTDVDASKVLESLPEDARDRLRAEALRRGVPVGVILMEGIMEAAQRMARKAA